MDKKKPFLKVDYSQTEPSEELLKAQAECPHKVVDLLDKYKTDTYFYGMKRATEMVEYMCLDCGAVVTKPTKRRK